jgi:hypothetical protein
MVEFKIPFAFGHFDIDNDFFASPIDQQDLLYLDISSEHVRKNIKRNTYRNK